MDFSPGCFAFPSENRSPLVNVLFFFAKDVTLFLEDFSCDRCGGLACGLCDTSD